jgi:RNA polymerase sigma-70 factor, ECF subfamily
MNEGEHLLAEETILNKATTLADTPDRSQDQVIDALVREHARLVFRIAYAVLRSHHDAEDAAQETFLRVLRHSARLAKVENRKTWLARIAWRVAVDRSQRRGRRQEVALENSQMPRAEMASLEPQAHDEMQGSQVGELVERLIAALPEKLRQPLILSTLEEMLPREVAATLGISEAAVRSRVFRARQILREKLASQVKRKQR